MLDDVARGESGYRMYTEDDVRLLRFIAQANALGLILRAVQPTGGATQWRSPSREVLAVLDAHLREIDRRLADLGELRSGLPTVFDAARSAVHQGNDVRLCRILDTGDDRALPQRIEPDASDCPELF